MLRQLRCAGCIATVLLLTGAALAGYPSPPFVETFHAPTLPPAGGTNAWTFTSLGSEGRIQVMQDRSAPLAEDIVPSRLTNSVSTAGTRLRGNIYHCTNGAFLAEHAFYLGQQDTQQVSLVVYEAVNYDGPYSRIDEQIVTAGQGNGLLSSGPIEVRLVRDRFYLIGAAWESSMQWAVRLDHEQSTAFGMLQSGFRWNVYPAPEDIPAGQGGTFPDAYYQRLTTSAGGVLRMDDTVGPGAYSTNQAVLRLDLEDYQAATLSFRHRESYDEDHPGDGVYLRVDASGYHKIASLGTNNTAWHTHTIDLAGAAAQTGVVLSAQTEIMFQQVDNYPWGNDGYEFDDIIVYAPPELVLTDIRHNDLPLYASHDDFSGRDIVKDIEITIDIELRGGIVTVSNQPVTIRYDLMDVEDGWASVYLQSIPWTPLLPALQTVSTSLSHVIRVPAATRLPKPFYGLGCELDAEDDLAEGNEGNNSNVTAIVVNHYSGDLHFGDIKTDVMVENWVPVDYASPFRQRIGGQGQLNGTYDFVFENLDVEKDIVSLDFNVSDAETDEIYVDATNWMYASNIRFSLTNGVTLTTDGAYGDPLLTLPAGLGFAYEALVPRLLYPYLPFPRSRLAQALHPRSPVNALWSGLQLCEETKPLWLNVGDIIWLPTQGQLVCERDTGTGPSYVRDAELSFLQLRDVGIAIWDAVGGELYRPSNESYYRFIDEITTDPWFEAGTDGGARLHLSATFSVPGTAALFASILPHFPYGSESLPSAIMKVDGGTIELDGDLFVASESQLGGVTTNGEGESPVLCGYISRCSEGCAGGEVVSFLAYAPSGDMLHFTPDGGLQGIGGSILDVDTEAWETRLRWGPRHDGTLAQQADAFTNANYHMPGHFVRGDQLPEGLDPALAPAVILLSGALPDLSGEMERPGAPAYREGMGDYAGLNFRVVADGDQQGRSTIGGVLTDWYNLRGTSKYYVRHSGVSGIQEAEWGTPFDLVIYDYPIGFTHYGVAYLSASSADQPSRTAGTIDLPPPSNFSQEFEEMRFTCLGDIDTASVPSAGEDKHLSYWSADFKPFSIRFVDNGDSDCATKIRRLTMAVRTACANVPQPLYGVLGFKPDGTLISAADGIEGVHSRLKLDNQITFRGPGGVAYSLTPVSDAYFNNYADFPSEEGGLGFVSLAGTLDVPFFDDLKVHLHTGADTNLDTVLYIMGGWTAEGETFFSKNTFDTANSGFPVGTTTVDGYRRDDAMYRARARRAWQDIIDFDYKLDWDRITRSFSSRGASHDDLLVLDVEHQLDYMDATKAEITFGAQFDVVPQINLVNLTINALGEVPAIGDVFERAFEGLPVVSQIREALDNLERLLSPNPEDLLDPVVKGLLDPVVHSLYETIAQAHASPSNPDESYYTDAITQFVATGGDLANRLEKLADGLGEAEGIATEIGDILDTVDDVLAVLSETVFTIEKIKVVVAELVNSELVAELNGDQETIDQINAYLEQLESVLGPVRETLTRLRDTVGILQSSLETAGDFLTELRAAVNQLALGEISDLVAGDLNRYFSQNIPTTDDNFADYSRAEVEAHILKSIKDRLYGSGLTAYLQRAVRERISDTDSAIREAVGSGFQVVNEAIRQVIADRTAATINDIFQQSNGSLQGVMATAGINGYATLCGDSMTALRLDASVQMQLTEKPLEFSGHYLFQEVDSTGDGGGCGGGAVPFTTVELKAERVPLRFGGDGDPLHLTVGTVFAFRTAEQGGQEVLGLAGEFGLSGVMDFEDMRVTKMFFTLAAGQQENYIAGAIAATSKNGGVTIDGGMFFGHACSLTPIESFDPEAGTSLGQPPFTGIYSYGEAYVPVFGANCWFVISAGIGAGYFYFDDGPAGGRIHLGVSGEALCAVSVRGSIDLRGIYEGGDLRLAGKGRVRGKAGKCPLCTEFDKTVKIKYWPSTGKFNAEY